MRTGTISSAGSPRPNAVSATLTSRAEGLEGEIREARNELDLVNRDLALREREHEIVFPFEDA